MPVTYKITKIANPAGEDEVDYFAAKATKTSDYSFDELAEDINNSTTVTQADAYAVLKAMRKYILQALLAGRRVVLNDLGAMKVAIRGKCFTRAAMQNEDFNPSSMIKGVAINFRPQASLIKDVRAKVALKRISSEAMA